MYYKFIGTYYRIPAYKAMKEIYENGPITASFYMFQDFVNYQSGIDNFPFFQEILELR